MMMTPVMNTLEVNNNEEPYKTSALFLRTKKRVHAEADARRSNMVYNIDSLRVFKIVNLLYFRSL